MKHEKQRTSKLQVGLADAAERRMELAKDAKEKYDDLVTLMEDSIAANTKTIEAKQELILKEFYERYLEVPALIGTQPSDEFKTLPDYLTQLRQWRRKDR